MKELSIEEKAKAYDEAIARAKLLLKTIGNATLGNLVLKNEFKNIFPELAESEDERMRNVAINACKYMVDNFENSTKQYEDAIAWLRTLKNRIRPKQEWKQENTDDLTDFENAMMHIGGSFFGENAGLDPNDTNVIKEQANLLLELVPKQEWSEEDENRVNRLIAYFEDKESFTAEDDIVYANWLKSLRPQNTWKPSKHELEVLRLAAEKDGACLMGLYQQLKKLR